jgi:hypothetical protein
LQHRSLNQHLQSHFVAWAWLALQWLAAQTGNKHFEVLVGSLCVG